MLLFIVPLWGMFTHSSQANDAQNATLNQALITEYTVKLENARNIQAGIVTRVACIEARDAELTSRSQELEVELGGLRRREQALASELATRQVERDQFSKVYDSEKIKYNQLAKTLASYKAEKKRHDDWVRQCKHDTWIFSFTCDIATVLGRLVGQIRSVEGEIATLKRQLEISQGALTAAEQRHNESASALALAQSQSVEVEASISQTENEIKQLKAVLSELRTNVQSNRTLLDDFEAALAEANTVDTADSRARTARKVARNSADVDQLVIRSSELVERANSVLPAGGQNCASR